MLRTYLLRLNRTANAIAREVGQLKDLVAIAKTVLLEQRKLSFSSHVYRTRKYRTKGQNSKFIRQPSHVTSDEDLQNLFQPFIDFLEEQQKIRQRNDDCGISPLQHQTQLKGSELQQRIIQTGSKVKVRWTQEELEGTDWKGGWYTAKVNAYDDDTDILTITYSSEPGVPYEEELLPLLSNGKIKLIWSPL